ncbi:MAG: hypothetical protein HQ582_15890 [Planctomycetes bacterium]|nr:hypothetical protein [Planctomycetota bacterium]
MRCVFLAFAAWLVFLAPSVAEEVAKPLPPTAMLTEVVRLGWLRARIVSGRITFGATRSGNMNNAGKSQGHEEQVSIRVAGQNLTASYEMSTADEEFRLDVTGAAEFHVRRAPKGDSQFPAVSLRQVGDKPLNLTLGSPPDDRVYRAASLWHLFLMEPEACRVHLAPLLRSLDRQWNLAGTAKQVEASLRHAAAEGGLPDPRRWAVLVGQLGDERFSRRAAADRELRAMGRVVFTYLRGLDRDQLDTEQHYRVRRIVMALSANMDNDFPPEIARWLAGDPVVWLALLARDDESTRRLAAERLEALLGEPIEFDPAAEPSVRAEQIERLRERIETR